MDISSKQEKWRQERPLFEAEFIHSHLLPFFNFNENTGDYEIKNECVKNAEDEDKKVAYETLNTGWVMWLRAKSDAKAKAVPEGFVLIPTVFPESKAQILSEQEVEAWSKRTGDKFRGGLEFSEEKKAHLIRVNVGERTQLFRDFFEMMKDLEQINDSH